MDINMEFLCKDKRKHYILASKLAQNVADIFVDWMLMRDIDSSWIFGYLNGLDVSHTHWLRSFSESSLNVCLRKSL